MSWLSGARARLHLLFAPRAVESRMNEEIAFHIDMETDRLAREEALPRAEARRRAVVSFGGVTQHKEELRRGRGLAWLGGMSLDVKLGFRMLVKYPGLTIVGGLAMSFAIWIGAVTFEMVGLFVNPSLPLPNGDRVVQIKNWDVMQNDDEPRAVRDFIVWRQSLTSVTSLGAYRDIGRNLIVSGSEPSVVAVAEITSAAFIIAPTPPLYGRVLSQADERPGAPPVIVIGHSVWETRFASDPTVIGRGIRIGDVYATVVGVMPKGFEFPVSHDVWMPLQLETLDQTPRKGSAINVFGRLAPGASMETAQAELTALGRRAAAELPLTHEHLTPRVARYTKLNFNQSATDTAFMLSINIFATMLASLLCLNVALLLFARAATRENELIVRSALGASRGRIIAQLFLEALVLGGVATAIGLAGTHLALRLWGRHFLEMNMGRLPFWYDPHLSLPTILYAMVLTVLGAVIAGVVPALKVTRDLGSRLKQGTAGSGLRFGGVWTAVIITQVAVTVAFPAIVFVEQRELVRIASFDVGFKARDFLTVRLEMDEPIMPGTDSAFVASHRARFGAAIEGLRQRLLAEPGVTGVTIVDRLPREWHPEFTIELDDDATTTPLPDRPRIREVSVAAIEPNYFDVLETPVLAGRSFHAGEATRASTVAIVDQSFVDQVLLGRNAMGRRFRFHFPRSADDRGPEEVQPWIEVVGVVKDLGMGLMTHRRRDIGVYHPWSMDNDGPINLVVHARGDPLTLLPTVRTLAAAVDPTLRPWAPQRMDQVTDNILWILRMWIRITIVLTAVALLLSLAGIYAVLSFTVARRTREIGVRVALGASPERVVVAIFKRPLSQVGMGVIAGGVVIGIAALVASGGGLSPTYLALLVLYVMAMMLVCLLACVVPTRRALSVQPTVALRAE